MVLPFFAITLFVSAFCLFLVQPIIGKLILPKLGGTPQVWNTCMVFFQTALLAGYGYTHTISTRLKLKQQLGLHGVMLFLPLFFLLPPYGPFNMTGYLPPLGDNPIPSALWLLTSIVGIPFLVVATSAPLLQKWFSATGHPAGSDPYFLYIASNLGSLLSLLLYPVIVEPFFGLASQSWIFAIGYIILAALVMGCVFIVFQTSSKLKPVDEPPHPAPASPPPATALEVAAPGTAPDPAATGVTATPPAPVPTSAPAPAPKAAPQPAATAVKRGAPRPGAKPIGKPGHAGPDISIRSDAMTMTRRLRWIALAAVPSSFMLGVTSHITTDLSPMPLFWLVPLSLYLLSFILVFSKWPVPWVESRTSERTPGAGMPHQVVLYVQALAMAIMIYSEIWGGSNPDSTALWTIVFFNVVAFFATALMCHGEMAKDRPGTEHLTEFFLLMSVGGMLGGMFNGLIAPIFFYGLAEFPIAIFLACIVRPVMKEDGWLDMFMSNALEPQHAAKVHAKGHKAAGGPAPAVEKPTSYAPVLDIALPLAVLALGALLVSVLPEAQRRGRSTTISAVRVFGFGVPLFICLFYYGRNIRYGLGIGAVLLLQVFYEHRQESGAINLVTDRSYFGIIRVKQSTQPVETRDKGTMGFPYTQLVHGHILHGQNFMIPAKEEDRGNPDRDFSRLATTYYHRRGPAGVVMEKFNWFRDPVNQYGSDARICASLVGINALTEGAFPMNALIDGWSEPPFATIGLGTGTMASYGRPFGYVHYYEIDNHIKRLSQPDIKKGDKTLPGPGNIPFFNYLYQADKRGCNVEVLMGDARLRMALPYMLMKVTTSNQTYRGEVIEDDGTTVTLLDSRKNKHAVAKKDIKSINRDKDFGGGPDAFYHMMVVDAFSSDAIPAHLITKEAIEMYFTKLTEKGILCVHTSNRFVNLPKVVAAVAQDLKLSYKTGHDTSQDEDKDITPKNVGRSGSEWVMVARKSDYLEHLEAPVGYVGREEFWTSSPVANSRYLWTDDHYNLLTILRAFDER